MRAEKRASQGEQARDAGLAGEHETGHGFGAADLRAANRACILEALERDGPLSRIALARRLGLSRTTVSHIVAALLAEDRIREDGALPASESGGRRS